MRYINIKYYYYYYYYYWVDRLVCEWSASKVIAYCIIYVHKKYEQNKKLSSEFHAFAVYKNIAPNKQQSFAWRCKQGWGDFLENQPSVTQESLTCDHAYLLSDHMYKLRDSKATTECNFEVGTILNTVKTRK